jgi:Zn-dependent metalloprotease
MYLSLCLKWILLSPVLAPSSGGAGGHVVPEHLPPDAKLQRHHSSRAAALITRLNMQVPGTSMRQKARSFLSLFPRLTNGSSLSFHKTRSGRHQTAVEFRQHYDGRMVLDRSAVVTFNRQGNVVSFNSDVFPITHRNRARITEIQAAGLVITALEKRYGRALKKGSAFEFKTALLGTGPMVTDVFEVTVPAIPLVEHLRIRVDAHSGHILSILNTVIH